MTQWEGTGYEPGSRLSVDTKSAGALILDSLGFRIVRNKSVFITYPVYDILLPRPEHVMVHARKSEKESSRLSRVKRKKSLLR